MTRVARLGLFPVLLGLGCVGLNPAYSDSRGSAGGDGSGSTAAESGSEETIGETGHGSADGTGSSTTDADDPDEWEFTDDEAAEFEAGVLDNLEWNAGAGALSLPGGEFKGQTRSRIFTTGGITAQLVHLEWSPPAPYGVGLFGPEVDELGGYARGGADTNALDLLLRFDREDDGLAPGETVHDASGNEHHGTLDGADVARISGVFRRGVENPGDGFVSFPPAALAPGVDEFTWTAWFRSEQCMGDSIVAFDAPDENDANTSSVWMTCSVSSLCPEPGGAEFATLQAGAFSISATGEADGPRACGSVQVDDGVWHHVAMRLRHANGGTDVEVFVDGEADGLAVPSPGQVDFAYGAPHTFSALGNPALEYSGHGEFDEIALWRRPLDDGELKALYNRGATDVTMRVRACMQPDCSDNPPFVGLPALGGVFRDSGPEKDHGYDIDTLDLVGVAFQYELSLERRRAGANSPLIPRVSMSAVADD